MRTTITSSALFIVCALAMWGCSGGSMPSSPSVLTPPTASGGVGRWRTLDDPPPVPDPTIPAPTPDPNAPTPMAVIINIIESFGSSAFMPNPATANVGDQIVFTNTDVGMHHIMLDDGTDLGEVQPGQSSAPMALMTPTATFHCTVHPTMVGAINGAIALPPYEPPPPDDYYGYY